METLICALYNRGMGESYENEIWKDIEGSPGRQISDHGNIRSFWSGKKLTDTPRKIYKTNSKWGSYTQIVINGDMKGHHVAKLVMKHFGTPSPGDEYLIGRKDHDIYNDRLDNLIWMTRSEVNFKSKRIHTSKYHGVSSYRASSKGARWAAQISKKESGIKLIKYFPYTSDGEIEAAKWRDSKALELFGHLATINFPGKLGV